MLIEDTKGYERFSSSFLKFWCYRIWDTCVRSAPRAKRWFLVIFNLPPLKGTKSLRLYSLFIGNPTLVLKKANVKKYSYVLTWNGRARRWGIKQPIFDCVRYWRSPYPNRKWAGTNFSVSVVWWLKNSHIWFQVCSYHSLEAVSMDSGKPNLATARHAPFSQIRLHIISSMVILIAVASTRSYNSSTQLAAASIYYHPLLLWSMASTR